MPQQAAFGDLEDDLEFVACPLHLFVVTAATWCGSRLAVDHEQLLGPQPRLQRSTQCGRGACVIEPTEAVSCRGPSEHHRRARVGQRRPARERFVADSVPVGQRYDRLEHGDDTDAGHGPIDEVRRCGTSSLVYEIGHLRLRGVVQATCASHRAYPRASSRHWSSSLARILFGVRRSTIRR